MPIPQEILKVERPKNTVVIVYGVKKDKYAVRQRIGASVSWVGEPPRFYHT